MTQAARSYPRLEPPKNPAPHDAVPVLRPALFRHSPHRLLPAVHLLLRVGEPPRGEHRFGNEEVSIVDIHRGRVSPGKKYIIVGNSDTPLPKGSLSKRVFRNIAIGIRIARLVDAQG